MLPKSKILILALSAIIFILVLTLVGYNYVYIQNGQLTFGHVVARVGDRVLTDDDLAQYEKIYSGRVNCKDPKAPKAARDLMVEDLKKATETEQMAKQKKLVVSDAEIEQQKEDEALAAGGIQKLLTNCGWNDQTFTTSVRLELLSKKLRQ